MKLVGEVAREFAISPDVIYKYIRLGKLKAYRKPMKERRLLVDREELRRLMKPVEVGPAERPGRRRRK